MSNLVDFLGQLLSTGAVVFRQPPTPPDQERAAATDLLQRHFEVDRLEVAGPPLPFRPAVAFAAAVLVRDACWFLVCHNEPPEEVARRTALPAPASAADHLSADLTLRFLPNITRRARLISPADALPGLLATVLRRWPLSGVLAEEADVADGPLTPPTFDDHPGLLLLYAERLAAHEKPAWLPEGAGLDTYDLVRRRSAPAMTATRGRDGER
jgi:hypothetical protein